MVVFRLLIMVAGIMSNSAQDSMFFISQYTPKLLLSV